MRTRKEEMRDLLSHLATEAMNYRSRERAGNPSLDWACRRVTAELHGRKEQLAAEVKIEQIDAEQEQPLGGG
jgi:hypothetical protein